MLRFSPETVRADTESFAPRHGYFATVRPASRYLDVGQNWFFSTAAAKKKPGQHHQLKPYSQVRLATAPSIDRGQREID